MSTRIFSQGIVGDRHGYTQILIHCSLQVHHRRHEKWFVLKGTVHAVLDDAVHILNEGDYCSIPSGVSHRFGGSEYCRGTMDSHSDPNNPSDELDIIRLQDDFSRT
ncbi:cupin domain-containing protein [bacterium]|nr:cupin domain-containing protein [bacterium]